MLIISGDEYNEPPSKFGRKDWHHNEKGEIDYPCYLGSSNPFLNGCDERIPIDKQKWDEIDAILKDEDTTYDERLDAARHDAFVEAEYLERYWN